MKKIIFICLAVNLIFINKGYSQTQFNLTKIDTSTINILIKLKIAPEYLSANNGRLDMEMLDKIFKSHIKIEKLSSVGFKEFLFYYIPLENDNLKIDNNIKILSGCEGFIIAVDLFTFETYRLHGFLKNDMADFLRLLRLRDYKYLANANSFEKKYKVDRLDLYCLHKSTKAKKKDTEIFPCLKYCGEAVIIH